MISVRYAKAIFSLAEEKNILDNVYDDFKLIINTFLPVPEFKNIITSPVVKMSDKKALFENTLKNQVNENTLIFLNFLINKNRESYIIDIARHFEYLYREHNNIKEVVVTSVKPLNAEIQKRISKIIENAYNCKVDLINKTSEKIIGGFIIKIKNQQLNLSVKSQLEQIKKELKSDIYKIKL